MGATSLAGGSVEKQSDTTYEDPRVRRSREAILAAATEVFIANGYAASSVDQVAEASGISKRTVYNIYGGKEALFRDALQESIRTAEGFTRRMTEALEAPGDVTTQLTDLARDLCESIVGGRVIPLRRLLIGEAMRFPRLAAEYYDRAPGAVMTALTGALEVFRDDGQLDIDDLDMASEHFAFLAIGASLDRGLFDTDPPPKKPAMKRADAGVNAFLRAYRPSDRTESVPK